MEISDLWKETEMQIYQCFLKVFFFFSLQIAVLEFVPYLDNFHIERLRRLYSVTSFLPSEKKV